VTPGPRSQIRNTSFSSSLTNGPNMLKGCIKTGWKGLPGKNPLAH
jgi:hypothetical protein